MMLEDNNDDLHAQLAQDDARMDEMQSTQDDLQNQLEASTKDFERVRGELRQRDREIDTLRAELRSLQGISVDSSKLLTEKLTLTRELATLKPELEHLRTQVSSDQNLLSEKLALQRQVSSLQVELEAERRTAQRATAKQDARQAEDNAVTSQLKELQTELVRERKDRQKAEAELQKTNADFESKKTVLESRLDAFRTKLRSTKEQLKDSQEQLSQRTSSFTARTSEAANANSRKRSLAQVNFDDSTTIGTPGAQHAAKRGKRASSALRGEKSAFSITPFLNRTASVAPESPVAAQSEAENNQAGIESASEVESLVPTASPSGKPRGRKAGQKSKALQPAGAGKANSRGREKAAPAAARKASMPPTLDQVVEEGDEGDEDATEQPAPVTRISTTKSSSAKPKPKLVRKVFSEETEARDFSRDSAEPSFIKKKRKILSGGLGKTIFDEDEGETAKGGLFGGPRLGALGAKKGSLGGLGGVKLGPKPGGALSGGGFGGFSPLKKDRKAGGLGGV
ncbi:MAG: hypothetical protein MMC23_003790 [Stictis urceolatum]|nr:hypothetical protein [Stictis urceolata]